MSGHSHGHGHGHGHGHTQEAPTLADAPLRGDLEVGAGEGKLLFVDAFSGAAGDMLVAALLDLGVPATVLQGALDALPIEGYRWEAPRIARSGIVARRFLVVVEEEQPQRSWAEIRHILQGSELDDGVATRALAAFGKLAEAEARVHGMPLDDVHFHEVGAVDSIVDIVAVSAALAHLRARVVSSPLPLGRGLVTAEHGPLPVPVPATVSCLTGVPTVDAGVDGELVTPTGACLIATAADEFARWPACRPERVGWGAGKRELPDRPNLLRLVLGEPFEQPARNAADVVQIETNVDDASGEHIAHAIDRALSVGALDAWAIPTTMKKGRPGVTVAALARRASVDEVAACLLRETGSLGVRLRAVERIERPRRIVTVTTRFGVIRVKVADGDGLPPVSAPEYDDCRAAAVEHDVPVREVYAAALFEVRQAK